MENIKVVKRNGAEVEFDLSKIRAAMHKAFIEENAIITSDALDMLTLRVVAKITEATIKVEEIQDIVEEVLIESGFAKVAKAYIIYRKRHEEARSINSAGGQLVQDFLNQGVCKGENGNASVPDTFGGLILSNSEKVTRDYYLNYIYDPDIKQAHENRSFHIHDLGMLCGYCAGWSLKQLIKEGIKGVEGRITSAPASHLSTLCNQMVNFLGIMQNEWAGAQAFSSFDTYLAPFVKVDNLTYKQTKQCIQSFVYGVNTPSRWGTQAPFSNITLDWTVPADLAELPCIVGGKEMDFCYKDCKAEMDMVNKAFIEIMIEGDANGRGFQYPIPTYSITKDFDWSETENNKLLFEMTAKYGTPYFSNYINSDMNPSDVRSMCCRLRLDLRELRHKNGGFFGAGESTGSIGVVTINMPQLAYLSTDEEEFYKRLGILMDTAARSLDIKRRVITQLLERGLYPYTKAYLGTFSNHFSTLGLTGMNEACLNAKWIGVSIADPKGKAFAEKVLDWMRNRLSDYQEKYEGTLFNLEATPAESTAYRFAKWDAKHFPGIITAGTEDAPYYTNSSNLPVDYTGDVFEALDHQDTLQTRYTSGTVFHTFLGERLPDWKAAAKLVRTIAENYRLPYYSMSPAYSVCPTHGYLNGKQAVCPHCGKETEIYERITGYYRPVKNWNIGKTQEEKERKAYDRVERQSQAEKTHAEREDKTASELPVSDKILIVTTTTCPKCKQLKSMLTSKGYEYDELLADTDEGAQFCREHGIAEAPTVIYKGKKYAQFEILKEIC